MAEELRKETLMDKAVQHYRTLKPNIRSGDLIFASGNYYTSRLIREATDSSWSHVGILYVAKDINRTLILESVEDSGVRVVPVEKYLTDYANDKPYEGEVVVARVRGPNASDRKKMIASGVDELTRPYDRDEITRIAARIALKIGRYRRDREYICSELVYECFKNAGWQFSFDARGFISPANIWSHNEVSLIGRIL
ncbi:MAG: YiiX/YebB-like N1pC/P60 family cysteine hydrolase [Pseudomonadota bacterium]